MLFGGCRQHIHSFNAGHTREFWLLMPQCERWCWCPRRAGNWWPDQWRVVVRTGTVARKSYLVSGDYVCVWWHTNAAWALRSEHRRCAIYNMLYTNVVWVRGTCENAKFGKLHIGGFLFILTQSHRGVCLAAPTAPICNAAGHLPTAKFNHHYMVMWFRADVLPALALNGNLFAKFICMSLLY